LTEKVAAVDESIELMNKLTEGLADIPTSVESDFA